MNTHPRIEITDDGSATLRSAVHGDTYHSLRGAVGEARHVFVEAGFIYRLAEQTARRHRERTGGRATGVPMPLRILEMGFGSGLNAWLTLAAAEAAGRAVNYTAIELFPVSPEVASRLGYSSDPRFAALHTASWGAWNEPAPGFRLRKIHGSADEFLAGPDILSNFDLIYWDAFAPDTQPELWTPAIFVRVFAATAPGGIVVTYSAKGDVRRALVAAGFEVERLPGALGKRHMLRATKSGLQSTF